MAKEIVSAVEGGQGVTWEDYKGKLFVVEPLEVEEDIQTVHGITDAVRGNVFVVLAKDGSKFEEFEDTLIFPKVLQSQVRRKIGSLVVGRLTQGEAKRGQNPPWKLAEATEGDLSAAKAFLAGRMTTSAAKPSATEDESDGFGAEGDDEDAF
jgi:hypothetical protein